MLPTSATSAYGGGRLLLAQAALQVWPELSCSCRVWQGFVGTRQRISGSLVHGKSTPQVVSSWQRPLSSPTLLPIYAVAAQRCTMHLSSVCGHVYSEGQLAVQPAVRETIMMSWEYPRLHQMQTSRRPTTSWPRSITPTLIR